MKLLRLIKLTLGNRKALQKAYNSPKWIEEINGGQLQKLGAEAVILDHDGILGPNRSLGPDETGVTLIREMISTFGKGNVFILSNTIAMKDAREKEFGSSMPEVIYIRAEKKPGTGGLLIASKLSGVPIEKIVVVDDGLLTGVLMATRAGAIAFYAKRKELAEKLMPKLIRLTTTGTQIALFKCVQAVGKPLT